MTFRLSLLALLCALPAQAAGDYYKDNVGDLKFNEPALQCMDISSVKVSSTDRKTFTFEVKTKAPINAAADNPPYFIVAVNSDGDLSTGTSAWTTGQDFCAFINLAGASVKDTRTTGDANAISAVSIEDNTLRFTLTFDANKQKRITFNVRSMIRRQSQDGKVPYTVLDSSVPANERYHEFKL
ncbi:MAG: hypothetical protein K0R17_3977 [Rariglobus sp.]|jgi:hypothetical protein|nr:hypothetical protein [Rariglobus sp.]